MSVFAMQVIFFLESTVISFKTASVSVAIIIAFTVICSTILAQNKVVGKKWPANQRVSINDVDHSSYHTLLQKYVDEDGLVNYEDWKANQADRAALVNYLEQLGQADSNKPASKEAKLAYWINAYNAVTLEGILQVYPTTSIRNHTAKLVGYNIWKNLYLISGDQQINLDSIEHKVLRPMGEPRIHFAIVCASIGCPRLLNEAYVADRLENQLKVNTTDFFSRSQNLQVDLSQSELSLSSIMSWFGDDFGSDQAQQVKSVAPYFPEAAKQLIATGKFRVKYLDYDWNLNAQK